jgi:hypothetical protein
LAVTFGMIKVSYDSALNVLILEYQGKHEPEHAEQFFVDIQKVMPKHGKGFRILTDLSGLQSMNPKTKEAIKKAMEFFNAQGVTEIIRVIPDPEKDIGFNIMSHFHYSKDVNIINVKSREEALARLSQP